MRKDRELLMGLAKSDGAKTMTTATQTRFSEPEMDAAFKRVQNPDDWRAPINCVVCVDSRMELYVITEAIEFYTATKATASRLSGQRYGWVYRVTAPGYRAGPAGP